MSRSLDPRHLQQLLASAGYYKGAIDGLLGPKSNAAVEIVGRNRGGWPLWWPAARRQIAAAQAVLNAQGHECGAVDGLYGHNTDEAIISWLSHLHGTSAAVERVPTGRPLRSSSLPTQDECATYYGAPGSAALEAQLTYVRTPFPMRLDWALDTEVTRIRVHEKCAPALEAALTELCDEYGIGRIRRLGLDRFAGSYVPRRMRGGSSWSMHAYGCAIDIYAAPNALRMRCPQALFCGEEYQDALDIMERHGWLPAVRLWGADAMHFQMARM
ncbi:M15 family metallopeptidase [Palleronia sp.]|uniref:M15 family metallopeptidase n=1 Tax=Palleronia sp. TaxID=1940284 RepID=UPI0035C80983